LRTKDPIREREEKSGVEENIKKAKKKAGKENKERGSRSRSRSGRSRAEWRKKGERLRGRRITWASKEAIAKRESGEGEAERKRTSKKKFSTSAKEYP